MSVFQNPRVLELLKQVKDMGPIGHAMFGAIKEVVDATVPVVTCFYQLDFSELEGRPEFYSCELTVLTHSHLVYFGFFPNFHRVRVVPVVSVQELEIENNFATGFEEEAPDPATHGYQPQQLKVRTVFATPSGQEVWQLEATRAETVAQVRDVSRTLTHLVGLPLSQFKPEG